MMTMTERKWNNMEPLPIRCRDREMRELVSAYLKILDFMKSVEHLEDPSEWIKSRLHTLDSFESRASKDMNEYAQSNVASQWALKVVPEWMAAGLRAGIHPKAEVHSASTLWMFCGMEERKYLPVDFVREVMNSILGNTPDEAITDRQIQKIATTIDRPPSLVGKHPTRQEVYLWATKRRHSEFLRDISLRLGEWIESNRGCWYHQAYLNALEKKGEHALEFNTGSALAELSRYARNGAVRAFLHDYYLRMPTKMTAAK